MSANARLEGTRTVLTRGERGYPGGLLELERPPARLYVLGDPAVLETPGLAVIGARKATPYGLACARMTGACAADLGVQVVSGAAIGCDQAAQLEAVSRGCACIAVLGSGADVVYPASSEKLLRAIIAHGGAVVSLQPWGSLPVRWAFAKRNPIIAGLSRALVICEAGYPSGTFSTAEAAEAAGREVLVFPGSVFSPNSRGSNYLLGQSSSFMPIWDRECLEIALSRAFGTLVSPRGPARKSKDGDALGTMEASVLRSLEASPTLPGALAQALGVPAAELMRTLGGLEMRGLVKRLVDGRYSPSEAYFLHGGA